MNGFKELGLSEEILSVLQELKFKEPTNIQKETIPLILKGKDLVGNAATGSGKTLAFAGGILDKIKQGEGVQALIMTPTRELAEQVSKAIKIFSGKYKLKILEVYGGVGIENQVDKLRRTEIVVGTPGRILDHLRRTTIDLSNLKFLILDEADRMVDMGFLPDVKQIIEACPKDRQTLLFSATTSPDVEHIAKQYMKKPVFITVEKFVDQSSLTQSYYDIEMNEKFSLIAHLLKNDHSGIAMVFCNTRRNVDLLAENLQRYDINAVAIHGGLTQVKRNRVIEEFRKNRVSILICTDVAARGLDIQGVTHVYNYDLPDKPQEYVHRIGRTARAGKKGAAINLVTNRDYKNFQRIAEEDSFNIERKELPKFEALKPKFKVERDSRDRGSRGSSRSYGDRGRSSGRFSSSSFRSRDSGDRPRRTGGFGSRDSGSSSRGRSARSFGSSSGRSFGSRDSGDRPRRTGGFGSRDSGSSRDRPRSFSRDGDSRGPSRSRSFSSGGRDSGDRGRSSGDRERSFSSGPRPRRSHSSSAKGRSPRSGSGKKGGPSRKY